MTPIADVELIIAVKRLDAAKTRLAPTFTAVARAELVQSMLADTLVAALAVPAVAGVTVISPEPAVLAGAHMLGARTMADPTPERHPDPLNNAIMATEATLRRQAPNIAVLQGDCPRCAARSLAAHSPRRAATLAASSATGTAPAPLRCSRSVWH